MSEIFPLYEDNHLLVLNKPAGLLTQPSGTEQESLEELAKNWIKLKYQKPGHVYLEAVHRLDKSVSGIVLFCKTTKALKRLHAAMRNNEMTKIYWAWVEGCPPHPEGALEHFIFHDSFMSRIVPASHPQAKKARLQYKIIIKISFRTLLEIELKTGRYHQIRVQLAAIDCPIWGDKRYGSKQAYAPGMIALHHKELKIDHPVLHVPMQFEAPLPALFPIPP